MIVFITKLNLILGGILLCAGIVSAGQESGNKGIRPDDNPVCKALRLKYGFSIFKANGFKEHQNKIENILRNPNDHNAFVTENNNILSRIKQRSHSESDYFNIFADEINRSHSCQLKEKFEQGYKSAVNIEIVHLNNLDKKIFNEIEHPSYPYTMEARELNTKLNRTHTKIEETHGIVIPGNFNISQAEKELEELEQEAEKLIEKISVYEKENNDKKLSSKGEKLKEIHSQLKATQEEIEKTTHQLLQLEVPLKKLIKKSDLLEEKSKLLSGNRIKANIIKNLLKEIYNQRPPS